MRVVFLGSPPFALPVFERLLGSAHAPVALVTPPDKPRGRGMKVERSPLVERAQAEQLAILQPATTKDAAFVAALGNLAPDVLLVASYGEILRQELLSLAPQGALNVHASLLPRWRGASPIQAALLAGDTETGVSIQRMVLALDEGDVLLARRTPIAARENAGELLQRLAQLGGEAAVEALDQLAAGTARFTPQDPAQATYARKIPKERGRIDWSRSAVEIDRHVRAFTPWPGARTTLDGQDVVLLRVRPVAGRHDAAPGTLFAERDTLQVATVDGLLAIERLKTSGKGELDAAAWLRGARLAAGARFGA